MEFIAHRINTIKELNQTPYDFGVEIDLRDYGERLVLQHDPFTDGEDFEEYLQHYKHGTMILNIKSERIEHKVLELIQKYNIRKYFFLDSSFPMIKSLVDLGEGNIALRFSEFEGIDSIFKMKGKVKWVWVDCFSELPLTSISFKQLKQLGYKICLVSPELQLQEEKIKIYKNFLYDNAIILDAICCKMKNIGKWSSNS
jgi:hypothetical protein